jgi:hypothetical protein
MDDLRAKAIKLLGQGLTQGVVAGCLGCTDSYISQLMSEPDFKQAVQEIRIASLQESTQRDNRINALEDKMISMVERTVTENPFAFKKGLDQVRALQMVNGLKRRGIAPDQDGNLQPDIKTVNITLPVYIVNKYMTAGASEHITMNAQNEVLIAGEQKLVTMQSGTLKQKFGTLPSAGGKNEKSFKPVSIDSSALD